MLLSGILSGSRSSTTRFSPTKCSFSGNFHAAKLLTCMFLTSGPAAGTLSNFHGLCGGSSTTLSNGNLLSCESSWANLRWDALSACRDKTFHPRCFTICDAKEIHKQNIVSILSHVQNHWCSASSTVAPSPRFRTSPQHATRRAFTKKLHFSS